MMGVTFINGVGFRFCQPMMPSMAASGVDLEVLNAVIGPDMVDVMHDFGGKHCSSDVLLHDHSVLGNVAAASPDLDVAACVNGSSIPILPDNSRVSIRSEAAVMHRAVALGIVSTVTAVITTKAHELSIPQRAYTAAVRLGII